MAENKKGPEDGLADDASEMEVDVPVNVSDEKNEDVNSSVVTGSHDMEEDCALEHPTSSKNSESQWNEASSSKLERRMKKDDSGISVDKIPNGDDDDDDNEVLDIDIIGSSCITDNASESNFNCDNERKVIQELSVKVTEPLSDKSSPDSGLHENELLEFPAMDFTCKAAESSSENIDIETLATARSENTNRMDKSTAKDLSDEDDEHSSTHNSSSNEDDDDDSIPMIARPKHKWFLCSEVVNRQYGISNNFSNDLFRLRAYGSLHMVERLELMYKMKRHDGCVNTLHFNSSGTRLASGSDDLFIVIWDWAYGEHVLAYDSGHRSNVFQAKFMPLGGDCHIVSCARDGQVRLAELSSTGVCKGTRRLASHRGPAHKLALEPDSPHTFLSCGEDGVVFEIDLRDSKPDKLLLCKENDRKVPLYTVFAHPSNPYEFAIGGKDHFVRVFDKRKICEGDGLLKKYCPHHLLNSDVRANVTCLVYNYNGSEILASYNDEDIYTFDTSHSDGAEFTHRYSGHRNSATVKGVNYFGPKSEFVVSGSDCGHIYIWEHDTEAVIHFMPGDEGGVVNCLEPHPHMPVLATSGLDDDIKIWVPSCEKTPKLTGLRSVMRSNRKERDVERQREPETIDGQMLWFLMHHLRRSARRRAREEGQSFDASSTDEDSGDESDDSENMPHAVQCTPS